jgi:hypothetical protein
MASHTEGVARRAVSGEIKRRVTIAVRNGRVGFGFSEEGKDHG